MAEIIARLPAIAPPDFPNDVIALSPYLYYRCNETSADFPTMADASGNSRTGLFTTAPSGPSLLTGRPTEKSYLAAERPRTTQPGSGHLFDSSVGGWTFQILIKQSAPNSGVAGFIASIGNSSTHVPSLLTIPSTSPSGFRIVASQYFIADPITSSVVQSYGSTVLIHMRYTTSGGLLELFENGVLTGSSSGVSFAYYGAGAFFADCPHPTTGSYDYPFSGSVSDIAVFRYPLTNVQIAQLASGI